MSPLNLSPLRLRARNWRTCPACGFRWDDRGGRPRVLPVEDLLVLAGMLRAGIGKAEAAKRLGVSRQTVTRWVRLAWKTVEEVERASEAAEAEAGKEAGKRANQSAVSPAASPAAAASPRARAERDAEARRRAVRAAWRGIGATDGIGERELARLVTEENRRRPESANRWAGQRGEKERERVRREAERKRERKRKVETGEQQRTGTGKAQAAQKRKAR